MLQNLHVKNLALIDEAEVDFTDGLNILTGETGAGKSIVLGSVNLALGGRYTADMIRTGANYGLVELTFLIHQEETLKKLKNMDVFPEDGQLVISRRLMDGRSICRINGETVTLAKLKEISSILIDIHGQHEHQTLLYKKNHLTILDHFSKEAEAMRQAVKEQYTMYQKIKKTLAETESNEADRLKEISFLQFEIEEIQNANLSVSEAETLEETYRQMLTGKRICENLEETYAYTSENGDKAVSETLSRAVRAMSGAASQDKHAGELYEEILEIENLLNDFNHDLRDYMDEVSFSAEAFYETENRLNEINHLKAKYGNQIEDILNYCTEKEERLRILQDYDNYLETLRKELAEAEKALRQESDKLSMIRKQAAQKLQEQIRSHLLELNFLDVQFEIHFEPTASFTSDGTDDVEFLISMNPGQPMRSLSEVASGGELSRIMLAIKTVMADKDDIETMIFDEIDVGISGRTAQKVSEKMGLIGRCRQVICITHLAQIAAMADSHFEIKKEVYEQVTTTTISRLTEEQSVLELARILGGALITDTVIENAKEMKKLASGLKKS